MGLPFASLPARIITSVFAAVLVASLAVTWISTRTTEGFLREKIDQKFPQILRSAGERLDLWYAQRAMDVGTFAHSETLAKATSVLVRRSPSGERRSARRELGQYLTYVLEAFPQFETLVLLDLRGDVLLQVGRDFDPPRRSSSASRRFSSRGWVTFAAWRAGWSSWPPFRSWTCRRAASDRSTR
jgi:hypothetical protein